MCGGDRKIRFDSEGLVLKFELILKIHTNFAITQNSLELKWVINF